MITFKNDRTNVHDIISGNIGDVYFNELPVNIYTGISEGMWRDAMINSSDYAMSILLSKEEYEQLRAGASIEWKAGINYSLRTISENPHFYQKQPGNQNIR